MSRRTSPGSRGAAAWAGLALVAGLAFLGARAALRAEHVTTDEWAHLNAARELRFGPGLVSNFEHPVLMKVLAAASLRPDPPSRLVDDVRRGRRLFPLVFALLSFLAGAWTLRRSGAVPALAVAALVAADPTFRGHAPLIENDVLVTFLLVASAFALDEASRWGRVRKTPLLFSGLLYGCALLAKFSAAAFLPVFLLAAVLRLRARGVRGLLRATALASGLVLLPALVTLAAGGAAAAAGTSRAALLDGLTKQLRPFEGHAAAVARLERLPKPIAAWAGGLAYVRLASEPGVRFNYFCGRVSGTGFALYFPVALAVKLPAAVVAGAATGILGFLAALALGKVARRRLRRHLAARTALPAGLAGAYLGFAMAGNLDIGVRHVLPVVAFLLVALAGLAATLLRRRRSLLVALMAAVVLGAALEAGLRAGSEVSFGNIFAGGPVGMRRFLSDSNVDWGQAQGRVFERTAKGDLGRVVLVAASLDQGAAAEAGIQPVWAWVPPTWDPARAQADAVFVSAHLVDVAHALEKGTEPWPGHVWLRGWLVPLVRGIERRAVSSEPFADAYVLYRLRPPERTEH